MNRSLTVAVAATMMMILGACQQAAGQYYGSGGTGNGAPGGYSTTQTLTSPSGNVNLRAGETLDRPGAAIERPSTSVAEPETAPAGTQGTEGGFSAPPM